MTGPDPYNRVYKTENCVGSECTQACPNILPDSKMHNTPSRPGASWKRGQKVTIHWAKNNHRGGMVRFAIVPVDKLMSRASHKKYALYYGCWEQGMFTCSGTLCGSDTDNEGFRRDFVIPTVIPDGVYALGVVWFGGLHFSRDKGQFPDYFSCGFIKIQGGAPLGGSFQPFWDAGDTGKFARGDECETAADEPGVCPKTGCTGPSFYGVAKSFKNGNMPPKLTKADYGATGVEVLPPPGEEGPPPTGTEEKKSPPSATPPTDTTPKTDPPTTTTPKTEPPTTTKPAEDKGICLGTVCCPSSCGKCGGRGCSKRPGGGSACCYSKVKRARKSCSSNPPPCVL